MIAADEYYKKCISEPRGSQASWNARDQHMTTTLLRIQGRLKDPKVRRRKESYYRSRVRTCKFMLPLSYLMSCFPATWRDSVSLKVVVWAHNSHVGDSTATTRGGESFERNETWNLGQMVRATFGSDKTWIVGQYTHRGTVTAAPDWGHPHAQAIEDASECILTIALYACGRQPQQKPSGVI